MAQVPVSFASLIEPWSKDTALAFVLDGFRGLGFKTTSWGSGGLGLTVANFLADFICQSRAVTNEIAKGALLRYASLTWAKARAYSDYDELPTPAVRTVGRFRLTSSAGAPPYTRSARSVWVTTSGGLRYVNTAGFTLASGGSSYVSVEFEAEYAGAAYNIPVGSTLSLVSAMPGVTVTNPEHANSDWITTDGADEQSVESLVQQCVDKWATRSWQTPAQAYDYWARQASPLVTRVFVDDQNPDGPGTLRVYIAGSAGGISDAGVIAAVDAVMQARRSITATVLTLGTQTQTVAIGGVVYVSGVASSTVQAGVEAAIAELFAAIPIGGTVIGTASGHVYLDSIVAAVRSVPGVAMFAWSAPTANVPVTATRVAVPSVTGLTYQVV